MMEKRKKRGAQPENLYVFIGCYEPGSKPTISRNLSSKYLIMPRAIYRTVYAIFF